MSEKGSMDIRQMPAVPMSPKGPRTLYQTMLDPAGTAPLY